MTIIQRRPGFGLRRRAATRDKKFAKEQIDQRQKMRMWNADHGPGTKVKVREERHVGVERGATAALDTEKTKVSYFNAYTVGPAYMHMGTAITLIVSDRGRAVAALDVLTVIAKEEK